MRVTGSIFDETKKANRKLRLQTQNNVKALLMDVKLFKRVHLGQITLALVASNEVPGGINGKSQSCSKLKPNMMQVFRPHCEVFFSNFMVR